MAIKAAAALLKAVSRFKEKHPIVFKVIVVLVITAAVFALMSALEGSQAQAAIKAPTPAELGGMKPGSAGEISDNAYEALRGLIHQSKMEGLGGTDLPMRAQAMNIIDKAQAAGEVVDFSQFQTEYGKFANETLRTLNGLFKLAREGDKQAFQWIKELIGVGKDVVYKITGVATR